MKRSFTFIQKVSMRELKNMPGSYVRYRVSYDGDGMQDSKMAWRVTGLTFELENLAQSVYDEQRRAERAKK